jgi:hypothetical protein
VSFAVDLHDTRAAEPAGWEALRRRAGLRANWAWPLLHADLGPTPGLVAVVTRGGEPTGMFAALAGGLSRLGYLDVRAPCSSAQPGWWFASSVVEDRVAVVRAFLRAVRGRRGLGAGAVLWRQLVEEDFGWLPRPRYRRETMPVALLDAPASVEAWLCGLSRSRRQDLRRIRRALQRDDDLDVRCGPAGVVATPGELAELARRNFDKYESRAAGRDRGACTPQWQQPLSGRDDVTVVAYRDAAGRLLAAGTILEHDAWPIWMIWGALPLDAGGRRHLYFDLCHRLVERAVEQKVAGIVLGKGMIALKTDIGARVLRQHAALTPF